MSTRLFYMKRYKTETTTLRGVNICYAAICEGPFGDKGWRLRPVPVVFYGVLVSVVCRRVAMNLIRPESYGLCVKLRFRHTTGRDVHLIRNVSLLVGTVRVLENTVFWSCNRNVKHNCFNHSLALEGVRTLGRVSHCIENNILCTLVEHNF